MEFVTLAEFVKRAGSVAEAARKLNMTYITVLRWTKGTHEPSRAMIELLKQKGIRWP